MPVQAIRTGGGLDGLLMVRAYLEHSQNYWPHSYQIGVNPNAEQPVFLLI
jgi:hypothetical protein